MVGEYVWAEGGDSGRKVVWGPDPQVALKLERQLSRLTYARLRELGLDEAAEFENRNFYASSVFGVDFHAISPNRVDELVIADDAAMTKAAEKAEVKKKALAGEAGTIALNRCWECGSVKIIGRLNASGGVERISKEEWAKADEALRTAWKKMFESPQKGLLSSAGSGWVQHFGALGFKAKIVAEEYCGC